MHLVSLALRIERGSSAEFTHRAKALVPQEAELIELTPPTDRGSITVLDALAAENADEHLASIEAWGRDQWQRWGPHHERVLDWTDAVLARL